MGKVQLTGKTVFLSGPMSGIRHYNVDMFATAHAICKEAGARRIFDPALTWLTTRDDEREHEVYMRRCVNELTTSKYRSDTHGYVPAPDENRYDMLVQLWDWEQSDGAVLEAQVARACGIECVFIGDVEH